MIVIRGIRQKTAALLMLVFLSFLSDFPLFGQSNSGGLARGGKARDSLILKLAVMGPGDALYFWFGHIGLVVED